MSTGKSPGRSPWKIKVTVEAQPEENDENDPFYAPDEEVQTRSRTVRVPLRDHDATPAGRSQARAKTPAGKKQRRSATPIARRKQSIIRMDSDVESQDDSRDRDFSLKPTPRQSTPKKSTPKKGRGKMVAAKTVPADDEPGPEVQQSNEHQRPDDADSIAMPDDLPPCDDVTGLTEIPSPPTFSTLSPPSTVSLMKEAREHRATVPSSPPTQPLLNEVQEAGAEKGLSRANFNFTKLAPRQSSSLGSHHARAALNQKEREVGPEQSEDEAEDDIEPAEAEIGEKTMMESEDFSMVSLESVESARELLHLSSPPTMGTADKTRADPNRPVPSAQPTRVSSISIVGSSAEEHPSGLLTPSTSSVQGDVDVYDVKSVRSGSKVVTPALEHSTRELPPPLQHSGVQRQSISSAAMSKTVAASQAMHRVVGVCENEMSQATSTPDNGRADQSVLHGFSASTRKRLRDGLKFGESLAQASPALPSLTSDALGSASVSYPRLSTAAYRQTSTMPALPPLLANIGVACPNNATPSLTKSKNTTTTLTNNSVNTGWSATSSPVQRPQCISPDSMEARWRKDRDAVTAQIQQADPSEIVTISSEEENSDSDMQPIDEREVVETTTSSERTTDDGVIRNARPRLSRSWQRQNLGSSARHQASENISHQHQPTARKSSNFWQPGTSLGPRSDGEQNRSAVPASVAIATKATSAPAKDAARERPALDDGEVNTCLSSSPASDGGAMSPGESPDEDGSTVSNDTGLFWHRNLPGVYDNTKSSRCSERTSSRLKGDKIDLSALLKLHTPLEISPLRTPGHGLKTPQRGTMSTPALPGGLRGVLKTPAPPLFTNSSPAKSVSRVSFAECDETRDITLSESSSELESDDTIAPDSSLNVTDTMSSDVRQLRDEIEVAYHAVESDATIQGDSVTEIDGSAKVATSCYTVETPSQQQMPLSSIHCTETEDSQSDCRRTNSPQSSYSLRSTHAIEPVSHGYSRTDLTMIREQPAESPLPSGTGVVSRVSNYLWSCLQAKSPPDSQLSHPLLKDKSLSLLPHIEPWTKTHYKMLDKLYQRYRRYPELFSPEHPDNDKLVPVINYKQRYRAGPDRSPRESSFADWDSAEMKCWGFTVKLTSSHVVVAALFAQLLALDDAEQYRDLIGEDIEMGNCNPGLPGDEIGVDKVALRLLSVMHGEKVRRAEKRGEIIERSGGGFVKLKDYEAWVQYM